MDRYGPDSQVLIDCFQNRPTMKYIQRQIDGQDIVISTLVLQESKRKLREKGLSDSEIDKKEDIIMQRLNAEKKEYVHEYAKEEAQRLLNEYEEEMHKPDNKILAHYKGIGAGLLVRDGAMIDVIKQENNVEYIHIPTQENVNSRVYSRYG